VHQANVTADVGRYFIPGESAVGGTGNGSGACVPG